MKLPSGLSLIVEERKVRGYLLSRTHPAGRLKSVFFEGMGFRADRPSELATALVAQATMGELADQQITPYGTKYVVEGALAGPRGSARVRSVWIVEEPVESLRLITAYPVKEEAIHDQGT